MKDYKKYYICSKCKEQYGSDYKTDSGKCPMCKETGSLGTAQQIRRIWERSHKR